ncbi:MAG: tetratricopeptide repeat protein [Bacteroidota bacterium]
MVRSTVLLLLLALLLSVEGSAQVKNLKEQQDYAFALGLFKDKNYQLSLEKFQKFTSDYPESQLFPDAVYYQAESQYQNANLDDAAISFAGFQEKYPDSKLADDAGFREGEVYFRQGDFRKAHEQLANVVKRWPEGNLAHEAAYWAGEAAFKDGNYPLAMRYYRIAFEHYPEGRIRDYAYFSIGFVLEKQEKYDEALLNYDEFLRLFPESSLVSSVYTRKGACLYQMGDYEKSLTWLEGLADSPDTENSAERMFLRGESHYKLGHFAQAEELYRNFLTGYPDNKRAPQVQYSMGWTQIEQQKYSEAIATFDELSKREGDLAEAALFRKGMALRLNGTLEAARTVFADMLAARPTGDYADNAHFELGMAAFNESGFDKALIHFSAVSSGFANSDVLADAWFMQGETLLKLHRPADAAKAYGSAVSIENGTPDVLSKALFRQGFSYFAAEQYGEAVVVLKNFLQRYPNDSRKAEALVWLGESHFKNEEFDDAVIVYNQALASTQDPELLQDALYGLGWTHFRAQQFADAERAFTKLTTDYRAGKNDVDANIRLGDAQYAQKKFSEAAKTYRYTSRMYPANPLSAYALLQLSSCEHRLGNTPTSISTLRGLLSRYPASEYADKAQFSLAWMYFQSKDYDVAITEFQKLITTYPGSPLAPQAKYSIADCYYNQGKYGDAEMAYRRVLEQHPDSPKVSDALDGLSQTLRMLGRNAEAEKVRQDWLNSNPKSSTADEVVFAEIRDLASQNDPSRSIPALQRFIAAHRQSILMQEAYLLLGRAYRQNDDLPDAEKTLRAAITLNPKGSLVSECKFELIETALAQQDRKKALTLCQELLADPSARSVRARVYYKRGLTYKADGNTAAASKDFEEAQAAQPLDPYSVRSAIEHALIEAQDAKVDEAVASLSSIASSRVDAIGAEAQYRMGEELWNARRYAEAEEALLRVGYVYADASIWNARAFLLLGRVDEAQGKNDAARAHYRHVIQDYAGSDESNDAQTRLEMMK